MSEKSRLAVGFIVLLLIVSTLTVLLTPVQGAGVSDQELTENDQYGWISSVEVEGSTSNTFSEPDNDVFIGQKEVDMQPEFYENFSFSANITNQEVLIDEVQMLVGDDWQSMDSDDWENESDVFEWSSYEELSDTGSFDFFADLGTFTFNVSTEATPGIYRIPLELSIENETSPGGSWDGPHTDIEYVYLEVAGNAVVNGRDLSPGITFAQRGITVQNQGDSTLKDVSLTLEESDLEDEAGNSVNIHNPDDTSYVSSIPYLSSRDFNFRFTVPLDMQPGDYEVGYEITATREADDVTVTEYGTITIEIDNIIEISASIEDNEVEKGTVKKQFTVNFENTGNLDLERVEVRPIVDGYPFSLPSDYYEEGSPTSEDQLVSIGDLAVGNSTEVTFTLGINQYIQVGSHKLSFAYEAYYFDDMGELSGSEGYYLVDQNPDPWTSVPWFLNVADSDEPYGWINVTKTDMSVDIDATSITTVGLDDTGYQTISVYIRNYGSVSYSDATFHLHTSGTPFVNPKDNGADTIEMSGESFTLSDGGSRWVDFGVIIDPSFIEDHLANDNPVYTAEFTMEGLNSDTLEEEELSFEIDGRVEGLGPEITVTGSPSDNTIKPGEKFNLTYTITNTGDATVRGLTATIAPYSDGGGVEFPSFESGQDAVFYKQATTPPGAYVWSVEPEKTTLAPGESTTVTFKMVSSEDMQEGATYSLTMSISGENTGETWNSGTTIRSAEGGSTKPMLTEGTSWIIVALILGIFFLIGLIIYKRGVPSMGGGEAEPEGELEEEQMTFEEEEFEEFDEESISEEEVELEEGELEPEGEDESEWTDEEEEIEEEREW